MRGDRPWRKKRSLDANAFTPHARGSTLFTKHVHRQGQVYPACAGIDPTEEAQRHFRISLPRMRGDRPSSRKCVLSSGSFTPHARGST